MIIRAEIEIKSFADLSSVTGVAYRMPVDVVAAMQLKDRLAIEEKFWRVEIAQSAKAQTHCNSANRRAVSKVRRISPLPADRYAYLYRVTTPP